jgi:5-methyltetrahydropteroyltriglutamate--homocysteine methyltransferase
MKKLLPTSTAGSLPKPSWLAQPETLWSPWKLQDQALIEGKQDALRLSLHEQQHAGIDIVSDGEQTRQHFVTTFIEHLSGVDFEKRETVRIRDRYDASVPTVVGAVARKSRCLSKMPSSCASKPGSRSNGPCQAHDHDRYAV